MRDFKRRVVGSADGDGARLASVTAHGGILARDSSAIGMCSDAHREMTA